ncbi:hypothetical protein ACPUYX_14675 [Desulfosporosinus sp. SYSU MS00001]|uniref:hypothetical protein n=1 Tax=Desulfosporosinus sp. SYSU MS00001 TaxID=3416284 RepID=UPI003CE87224
MKKSTKLLTALLAVSLLLPVFSSTALASSRAFSGYLLPKYQGFNYTSCYQHNQSTAAIYARADKLTNTDKCYLWAAKSDHTALSTTTISFVANSTNKWLYFSDNQSHVGEYVCLGMMNYYSSSSGAYVDGYVDFLE